MADEDKTIYNPSTGITNTQRDETLKQHVAGQRQEQQDRNTRDELIRMEEQGKAQSQLEKLQQEQSKLKLKTHLQVIKERIKEKREVKEYKKLISPEMTMLKSTLALQLARVRNRKLMTEYERLKLLKRIGAIKQAQQPIMMMHPRIKMIPVRYPAFATQETMGDIDSAFALEPHGELNNLWGNENYYDEDYFKENWFGSEFDTSIWTQLNLKPSISLSPLLW